MSESNVTTLEPTKGLKQGVGNTAFNLNIHSLEEGMKVAAMIANSQLAPKDFRGKPEDTMVAMMLGNEVGLNPIQSIQNIAVINGRPSIWGDAMLALVQNHPMFGNIEETFDESTMTAICTVTRRGDKAHTVKFSQADAQKAGLFGKTGPWQLYPKRMLQLRARGFALRDKFSDALCGLISREEAMDLQLKEVNTAPDYSQSAVSTKKPDLLPEYPQDQFEARLPTYLKAIESGSKSAGEVISTLQTKHILSEAQIKAIENSGTGAEA